MSWTAASQSENPPNTTLRYGSAAGPLVSAHRGGPAPGFPENALPTTGSGPLSGATLAEVRRLHLVGSEGEVTPYRVPTLSEALAWSEGRAVLTLDVKEAVPFRMVTRAVRRAGAEGRAVVIVYGQADLEEVHALAPELVVSTSAGTMVEPEVVLAAVPAVTGRLHAAGVRAMLGTFGAVDERAQRALVKRRTRAP